MGNLACNPGVGFGGCRIVGVLGLGRMDSLGFGGSKLKWLRVPLKGSIRVTTRVPVRVAFQNWKLNNFPDQARFGTRTSGKAVRAAGASGANLLRISCRRSLSTTPSSTTIDMAQPTPSTP